MGVIKMAWRSEVHVFSHSPSVPGHPQSFPDKLQGPPEFRLHDRVEWNEQLRKVGVFIIPIQ